ncbi:LPS-assembly protein LptD [Sphingomonas flavalba]|uniref:LPS-assembly protein LptD n=1 Tax=Sphingomonas flavalba TaxID=2559804 RepID=UPI001EEF7A25|nr:LPS assembly protein LptD [Sphingomonas flavalba]
MTRRWSIPAAALPLAIGLAPAGAAAQTPPAPPPETPAPPGETDDKVVAFSAGQIEYQSESDVVTATGEVRMSREGNRLRADTVSWNRRTGAVVAEGSVAITNPEGDTAYGDHVDLTDTLKDGVVENLLVVLQDGGRLAARRGTLANDVKTLEHAAYTPCAVVDDKGCPKKPTWKVTAAKVVYDPNIGRATFKGARIELFGLPLIPLPGLSTPTSDRSGSGLLVPDLRYNRVNGFEFAQPYYFSITPNRDLTVTPHIYSSVLPLIEAKYRALTGTGAYQIHAIATSSRAMSATLQPDPASSRNFRGYIEGSGRFQLDPYWSVSGSFRVATDRTFLRRYDFSRDDRLRSTLRLERLDADSYFSLAGWATQTLRIADPQGQQPIALPEIDYRRRISDPLLGGKVELQLNSLAIGRTAGQDTQRAFAGLRWDLRRYTPLGQEVTFTAYARADVYHTDETLLTATTSYRGEAGWQSRGIAALAIDVKWPFVGEFLGGTQQITPRVQIVASPDISNLKIPNEDARAFDLEDSNLFALNRFPGYDRFEDGQRITYGVDYALSLPDISIDANVGQSYRLNSQPVLFPDGTGLSRRTSDIVGRATVRFRDFVTLTERFRLDKDSLAVRRNEIDATIGSRKTYAMIGYLRLNRDIDDRIEDLRDREEIRLGGRVQFAKYWSIFGSAVVDLTDKREDPLSLADGFSPVRHRLGIAYEDDCVELGVTWRRDYEDTGDARRGNSFLLRLAFKNLGR